MPKLITLKTLADQLGVDPSALRYLIRVGKIPSGQKIGRERVFMQREAAAIGHWLAQWKNAHKACNDVQ